MLRVANVTLGNDWLPVKVEMDNADWGMGGRRGNIGHQTHSRLLSGRVFKTQT